MTSVTYKQGMEKLTKGILRYRNNVKADMVKQLKEVSANPRPTAVFITCVDSRLQPSKFMQTDPGDMFVVRNVGNMVPHADKVNPSATATEPAAMELGCVVNGIKHVLVCGHSDCKAMNLLHSVQKAKWDENTLVQSPIRAWMNRHGINSLLAFEELEKAKFRKPLVLRGGSGSQSIEAFIDFDQELNETDRLSQVHCLKQMENVRSYEFMDPLVRDGKTHVHALWFDISSGEIHYFSKNQKHFMPITDNSYESLLMELDSVTGGKDVEQAAETILQLGKDKMSNHKH